MRRVVLWAKARLKSAQLPAGVVALLGAGLVLRLLWVSFHDALLVSDFAAYNLLATQFALFGTYGPETAPELYWPPGWPLLLGATYEVFGIRPETGTVVAALLSWGATVAGAVIAVRLLRPTFALAAVAAMSIYPAGIAYTAVLGTEHLAALLLTVMVALMLKEQVGAVTGLLLGALDGALLLTRPEFGVVMAGTLLVIYLRRRKEFPRPAVLAACGVAGALLVLSPWIVRNALTFHEFVPTSASGGAPFYRGTLDVRYTPRPEPEGTPPRSEPRARDSFFWREGLDNVANGPFDWLKLNVLRLERLYLSEHNTLTWATAWLSPTPAFYAANTFWLLLLALAIAGLVFVAVQWREIDPRWLAVVVPVVGSTVLKVMFVVQGRHRLAFIVPLILLSAFGAQQGWEKLARARTAS